MSNTILDEWSDKIPGGGYIAIVEFPGERLPFQWTVQNADDKILARDHAADEDQARLTMNAWIRQYRAENTRS